MDQTCPKCDFSREEDSSECPKCGIIYEKFYAYLEKKKKKHLQIHTPQKEYLKRGDELTSDLLDFFDFISDIAD